ncbi:MAG: aspartate carbamoyltransferase regulatory subunit [Candidatus ainarchaeum sp.]|nr:aspartate carbamoyltransferase regulatory subunit [Candidatus ainarchaeum sp.]
MPGELVVEKIENGTVIDHIPAGLGLKVIGMLKIPRSSKAALLLNVPSKRMGSKDILKVSGKQLDEKELSKIALVAPAATLNVIRDGAVVEKASVRLPKELKGVAKCPNPNCVTNHERVEPKFGQEEGGKFRCEYCEMVFEAGELIL